MRTFDSKTKPTVNNVVKTSFDELNLITFFFNSDGRFTSCRQCDNVPANVNYSLFFDKAKYQSTK